MAGACDPASGRPRTLPRDVIQMAPDAPRDLRFRWPRTPPRDLIQMAPDAPRDLRFRWSRTPPRDLRFRWPRTSQRDLRFRWPQTPRRDLRFRWPMAEPETLPPKANPVPGPLCLQAVGGSGRGSGRGLRLKRSGHSRPLCLSHLSSNPPPKPTGSPIGMCPKSDHPRHPLLLPCCEPPMGLIWVTPVPLSSGTGQGEAVMRTSVRSHHRFLGHHSPPRTHKGPVP